MATLQRTTDDKFKMICNMCNSEKVNFDIGNRTKTIYGERVTTTVITFKCLNTDCINNCSEEY